MIAAQGRSERKNSAFPADLTSKRFRSAPAMSTYPFSRHIAKFNTPAKLTWAK
jgi:hypothetical protein